MLLLSRRMMPGVILCVAIFAAAFPLLSALHNYPQRTLMGPDIATIGQGSGPYSINESLLQDLRAQGWVQVASAEILAFVTLNGEPAIVRGVEWNSFLELEGGQLLGGQPLSKFLLLGAGFQERTGISVGSKVVVSGSTVPKFLYGQVTGLYRTPGPTNDETLLDLERAREITGLSAGYFHHIRVRVTDVDALLGFLEGKKASAQVTTSSGVVPVNSNPAGDPRVLNIMLRLGHGRLPRDYLTSLVIQGGNSLNVVVWGLTGMGAILVTIGIAAAESRVMVDRLHNVAILRAVGAGNTRLASLVLRESLQVSLASLAIGIPLGYLVAYAVGEFHLVVTFSHNVYPEITFGGTLFVLIIMLIVIVGSALAIMLSWSRLSPRELLIQSRNPIASKNLEEVLEP